MNIEPMKPRKEERHWQTPYFTPIGWLVIAALFVACMIAGVELHDWLMGGIAK